MNIQILHMNYPRLYYKLKRITKYAPQKIVIVLYIVKQKKLKYFGWKTVKVTKRSHAFKGYAKSYNVEILIFFF